jgi:hypothetical protein
VFGENTLIRSSEKVGEAQGQIPSIQIKRSGAIVTIQIIPKRITNTSNASPKSPTGRGEIPKGRVDIKRQAVLILFGFIEANL